VQPTIIERIAHIDTAIDNIREAWRNKRRRPAENLPIDIENWPKTSAPAEDRRADQRKRDPPLRPPGWRITPPAHPALRVAVIH